MENNSFWFCKATVLRQTFQKYFINNLISWLENTDFLYWNSVPVELMECEEIVPILNKVSTIKWSVRIENPSTHIDQIVEYLARYVHRVAITNSRIENITDQTVSINYKIYRDQEKGKPAPIGIMKFEGLQFIHRFLQHIPPARFRKIRYYGLYGSHKTDRQAAFLFITNTPKTEYKKPISKNLIIKHLGINPDVCQNCKQLGTLVTIDVPVNLDLMVNFNKLNKGPPNLSLHIDYSIKSVMFEIFPLSNQYLFDLFNF